jgi:dephospho-CoA kinase
MLERCGARIIDADALVHKLLRPGTEETRQVAERFGSDILAADGAVNRRRLGKQIFADTGARLDLNEILHPAVRREEEKLKAALDHGGIVVTDAALLVETGRYKIYDRLVVVTCDPDLRLARLLARDQSLTTEDAHRRIAAQAPVEEKIALADYIIETSGSLADSERRTRAIYTLLMEDLACKRQGLPLPPRRRGNGGGAE